MQIQLPFFLSFEDIQVMPIIKKYEQLFAVLDLSHLPEFNNGVGADGTVVSIDLNEQTSATLNEIASSTGLGLRIEESAIPLDRSVVAASEMLGIDPLQAANEGKIVAVVEQGLGSRALEILRDCPLAEGAAVVGAMTVESPSKVVMTTKIGGTRVVAEPSGELLPRIC